MGLKVKTKPCPFCGYADETVLPDLPMKGVDYWIECPRCKATGPRAADYPMEAVELWDTRAE